MRFEWSILPWLVIWLSFCTLEILSVEDCPANCTCSSTRKSSVTCKGITFYPHLLVPNSFTDFQFIGCKFPGGILPQVPTSYQNITELSLHSCVEVINGNAFTNLKVLEKLTITKHKRLNFTSDMPFKSLNSLLFLSLSDNELAVLPKNFAEGLSSLSEVDVSNNHLETLSFNAQNLLNLHSFNLTGNRWKCDCQMQWVKEVMKSQFKDVSCESPPGSEGKNIYDVESDITCGLGDLPIAFGIAIPLVIVFLLVSSFCLYKCIRHRKRSKKGHHAYRSIYGDTVDSNPRESVLA